MRKRFLLSFLVALLTTLSLRAYDFKSGDLYYNITSDTTVEVTYQKYRSDYNYSGFKTATIPETVTNNGTTYSVTSIGMEAFYCCYSLTSITLPNSVTSIGEDAFWYCSSLTSITIPNSVTSIGSGAFSCCYSLTSITLPNSVTSIGEDAFSSCSSLTSIILPNSVTSIGGGAFSRCSSLTSLTIPNSVTSIGSSAFSSCSSLTSIVVESGNTTYDSRENCNALIETATNTLIAGCQSTTIPNSVTSIGNYALYGCSSLTSITLPNSVTSIGERAFSGCSSLTSVVWNAKNCAGWSSADDAPFYEIRANITSFTFGEEVETIPLCLCYGMSSLTSITLPDSVTSIGNYALYGCSSLTSITIPDSVTSIGEGALKGCSSLSSLTIPNSVTSIGNCAFQDCSSITSITIPNSVTSIGERAFGGCSSLTSVIWNAKNCAGWGYNSSDAPFYDICANITSFTFGEEVETIPSYLCYGMSSLTSITIGNSVTSIGKDVFAHCSSLTSITIGNSVTSIGSCAFWGCSSLTSITIGNFVTSIGGSAFAGCSSLTSITLPNSVTSIVNGTFYNCSSLTSITIPNSVTSIGEGAFSGCSSLTSVVWNAKNCAGWSYSSYPPFYEICANITSFTFGEEVETIPSNLCYGMSSLTSITLPNSVTSIGMYAFENCSSLTKTNYTGDLASWCAISFSGEYSNPTRYSHNLYINDVEVKGLVTFPETVTSIGDNAFSGCTSITSLNIPNSVTSIGDYAFYNCSSLADIYCYATTPPVCDGITYYGSFVGVSKHCYIHVPAGTIRDYQMADGWRDFYHFYEISELPDGTPTDQVGVTVTGNYATFSWPVNPTASSYTLTITKDGEVFCTLIFNNMGQLVGMAFAPARDGKPSAKQDEAQSTAYGFSFVVTNLDANSHYTYTFIVNGADNEVIETYNGAFDTTEETTALSETEQANKPSRKILRNGQVLILRNGVAYDMMGQRM